MKEFMERYAAQHASDVEPTTWTYIAAVLAGGSLVAFFVLLTLVSLADNIEPAAPEPEPMPGWPSWLTTIGFFGAVVAIFALDYWLRFTL